MEKIIKRGDIYYANLNLVIGSEQGGILPTHTIVNDFAGLDKDSVILLEQIRTIDKQRLREYLGTLDGHFLVAVDKALAISVAL